MPLSEHNGNGSTATEEAPLTQIEIRVLLFQKGKSIAALAERWNTTSAVLSRVIHRRGEYVYQRERKLLARYLGVSVSRVGREPNRDSRKSKYAAA